jgi:hypothetical protein
MKRNKEKNIDNVQRCKDHLMNVAGIIKNGPRDLADNHDKYLYEIEKKEAKKRVLKRLVKNKPLKTGKKCHKERTAADTCRP